MENRIQFIDRLKGLAIVLVVIGHLLAFTTDNEPNPFNQLIVSFHMPLFMFLSGLVISPPHSVQALFYKGIRFMFPMCWVGLLFTYIIGKEFTSLFTDYYNNGYWYLYVLTIFYMVMYLYGKIHFNKYAFSLDLCFLVFVYACFSYVDSALPCKLSDMLDMGLCKSYWMYFFIGHLVRKHDLSKLLDRYNIVFTVALLSYFPLLYAYDNGIIVRFCQIVPLTAIVALVYLFRNREHSSGFMDKWLANIGRCTLDIYIYHYFVLRLINLRIIDSWLRSTGNYIFEVILLVGLAILTCIICMMIGKILRKSQIVDKFVYGNSILR